MRVSWLGIVVSCLRLVFGVPASSRASPLPQLTELIRGMPSPVGAGLLAKVCPAMEIYVSLWRFCNSQRHHLLVQRRPPQPQSCRCLNDFAPALRKGRLDQLPVESLPRRTEGFMGKGLLGQGRHAFHRGERTNRRADVRRRQAQVIAEQRRALQYICLLYTSPSPRDS